MENHCSSLTFGTRHILAACHTHRSIDNHHSSGLTRQTMDTWANCVDKGIEEVA